MQSKEAILALLLLIFGVVGGLIDTYTSHRFFPPKIHPPEWLSKYILIWWLWIFVGTIPFLMVYTASGFDYQIIKVFITFGVLASVGWDLMFSKLWSGRWISESCETWFWIGSKNLGINQQKIFWFHIFRVILFIIFYYIFFIRYV